MKLGIYKSFLVLLIISITTLQAIAQTTNCTSLPVPQITLTIGSTVQGAGASIANVPAGATSSFTVVTAAELPNVLPNTYRAKIQLNGCTSEKLFRQSPDRNRVQTYSSECYRIVNVATGKVLEVVGNSLLENASIRQATPNGSINQTWQMVSDNPFSCCGSLLGFISKNSGKWLSLSDFTCADGTSLVQKAENFLTSQRFSSGATSAFTDKLAVTINGCTKVLKASTTSNNIGLAPNDTTAASKWKIEVVACPTITCPTLGPITGASTVCSGASLQLKAPSIKENGAWSISNAGGTSRINADGVATISRPGTQTVAFSVIEGACLTSVTKTITVAECSQTSFDPAKCYYIQNKVSGGTLEVKDGSSANGAQIFQYGGISSERPQLYWQIVSAGNGTYNIISKYTGKYMDADDCTEGAIIKQYTNKISNSQKWRIEPQADGSIKILNEACKKYLRVAEGGKAVSGVSVGIKNDDGRETFKWYIQPLVCRDFPPVVDVTKCYNIVNKATNKVLEIKNASKADGAQVYQWEGSDSRPQQVWQIKKNAYIDYSLYSPFSNKYINALNCNEAAIIKQDNNSAYNWGIEIQDDGFFKILESNCNKHIRVSGSSTANGASVGVRTDYFTDNFKWSFLEVGCPATALSNQESFVFNAITDGNSAKLSWITTTENDYFNIERMNAKGEFEKLDAVNGNTNTDRLKHYTLTDYNPLEGDNYYRIGAVSNTAPPQYSEVKKVVFSKTNEFIVFPNPADEYIDIDIKKYEGKPINIYLYNSVGNMVKTMAIQKASSSLQRLDLHDLSEGVYMVRIQTLGKKDVLKQVIIAK